MNYRYIYTMVDRSSKSHLQSLILSNSLEDLISECFLTTYIHDCLELNFTTLRSEYKPSDIKGILKKSIKYLQEEGYVDYLEEIFDIQDHVLENNILDINTYRNKNNLLNRKDLVDNLDYDRIYNNLLKHFKKNEENDR